jgi:hypothetical protein
MALNLVSRAFNDGHARVGNRRAHGDLIGQRRNRAARRCQDEGRDFDLRQQRRGIHNGTSFFSGDERVEVSLGIADFPCYTLGYHALAKGVAQWT